MKYKFSKNLLLLTAQYHIKVLHYTLLEGAEIPLSFVPESLCVSEKYYYSSPCAQAEQVLMPQLRLLTSILEQ